MRATDIHDRLKQQPFQPFRMHLTNGVQLDVRHPELVIVMRHQIIVALPTGDDDLPEKAVTCDPLHITHVEPLPNDRKRRTRKRK